MLDYFHKGRVIYALDRAVEAFELASDRRRAMKVQIAFGEA